MCYFDSGSLTRSRRATESACFGNVFLYTARDARERGFPDEVHLCFGHSRRMLDECYRCAFVFDRERCSDGLRPCPDCLFKPLDDISNSVAAYVCRYHRSVMDSSECVTEHPRYQAPPKRVAVAVAEVQVGP